MLTLVTVDADLRRGPDPQVRGSSWLAVRRWSSASTYESRGPHELLIDLGFAAGSSSTSTDGPSGGACMTNLTQRPRGSELALVPTEA